MHSARQKLPLLIISIEILLLIGVVGAIVYHPRKAAAPAPAKSAQTPAEHYNPPQITPVAYAKGLSAPTSIAVTPDTTDTRLFVTERAGRIRAVDTAGAVSEPVLDISAQVLDSGGEMGLLGIAFDPKFTTNRYMYIFYISKQKQTVLARYELSQDGKKAVTTSAKVLLTLQQEYGNHKGGQLQFGPDGYLYVGIGDGGSSGDPHNYAQDTNTWFGKILRLDTGNGSYAIPASNPFAKAAGAKPEIWATGLRNPWRFSFDRKTGDLYVADVGQNMYEEINVQKAGSKGGENYGWRCYEAGHDFNTKNCRSLSTYISPVIEYDHSNNRCSVTGGYVYRGASEPALTGKYLYADFCSGELFYTQEQNGSWKPTLAATTPHKISTFGQDNAGELYFADIDAGSIFRLTDAAN